MPEPESSVLMVRSPLRTEVEIRRPQGSPRSRRLMVIGGHATTPGALYRAVERDLTEAERAKVRVALDLDLETGPAS
jgi:hypothetical protein